MKIYSKKRLELKETVYKKKNVILKEDDTVFFNDTSGMVDALNKDGDVTVSNNTNQSSIDVPILTQNNKVTPQDLNKPEVKNAIDTARKTPNTNVELTASKVSGKVTPITQTTNTIQEGVLFTKKEMNNFLKSL